MSGWTSLSATLGQGWSMLLADDDAKTSKISFAEMFQAGGVIGVIIIGLSIAMVALIVEHVLHFRRRVIMPPGLDEEVRQLISQGRWQQAEQRCSESSSFLGRVIAGGIAEAPLGYEAIDKGMEDASAEQAARMYRKIEYLSVISNLAPMLGLLGTVWGMILAFMEFEVKANPQVSELAPGIYRALVTTFLGLSVAVPCVAAFSLFRNRIDELVAEGCQRAELTFLDYKQQLASREAAPRRPALPAAAPPRVEKPRAAIPPVAKERDLS